MGSFDVGCGLSNLTVHYGDEAGFLILDKFPRSNGGGLSSSGKSFLSGSGYLPFLPPVFGVYDDYGRLRQIRESTTTKVLEKLFDRPVEVVMDCLGSARGIYDSYDEIYKNYMIPECRSAVQYDTPIEDVLVAFGFIKDHNTNGDESFVYDAYELVPNDSRSTWTISDKQTGREFFKVRSGSRADDLLEAFGNHTRVYPGFSPNDYERIRLLNRLGGMYFLEEVFVKMDEFSNTEHYMNNFYNRGMARREKELAEFFDHLRKEEKDNRFPFSGYLEFTEDLSRDVSLPRDHWRLLEAYENNENEFHSIVRILRIADSLNRVLAPTYCGEQTGNDRASLMLNHISKQILDVRKKEYEGDIDDDDDEEKYWDLGVEL